MRCRQSDPAVKSLRSSLMMLPTMLLMPHFKENLMRGSPTICSFNCLPLPSCPSFCCKVSPPMPRSCLSSCSVSCIMPCKQPCCQAERYPPNVSTQTPAICPSQCAIRCDNMYPAHYCPASSEQSIFLTKSTPTGNVKPNFRRHKAMQHLHHMPQFLLIVLFTQLSPVLLHGATKISTPIQNLGTNITGWKVSCGSRSRI